MYMTGPTGKGGCTTMACLERAVVEVYVSMHHPSRQPYRVIYPFCPKHKAQFDEQSHKYPNRTLVKEVTL